MNLNSINLNSNFQNPYKKLGMVAPAYILSAGEAETGRWFIQHGNSQNLPNVEKCFYFFYVIDELIGSGRLRKLARSPKRSAMEVQFKSLFMLTLKLVNLLRAVIPPAG